MLSSYSGIFVFGTGCIIPFTLAFPRPFFSDDYYHQLTDLKTGNDSGNADSSSPAPSSTVLPTLLVVSARTNDGDNQVTTDPRAIAEALVLFVLLALIVIAVYWSGPSFRRTLLRKLGRQPVAGPGFGFDGLTKAQLKAVRLKEKEEGMNGEWFIRLPAKPPAIVLKEFPLPPIQMPAEVLGKSVR